MRKLKAIISFIIISSFVLFFISCENNRVNNKTSLEWEEGFLDIHFIHSGGGNVSFMIFPDGTSLLFDAGDAKQRKKHPYYPPFDNKNISTGERIANYINYFLDKDTLDYALISHFHSDHYGEVTRNTPIAKNGAYKLTGITAVGDIIPIKKLIDRAYPEYNYPLDLLKPNGKVNLSMDNYLKFLLYQKENAGLKVEQLFPGTNKQIILRHQPLKFKNFEVRNIKVNNLIWAGKNNEISKYTFTPPLVNNKGYYNENPLSLALKISYGKFDYYVGGDLPGINDYPDYDIETSIGKILGEVDVLTLDHHGHKDATNAYFLKKLKPQVIAHQSLHDPHFSKKVQNNLQDSKADVFSPFVGEEIKKQFGRQIKKVYKSTKGHFFIRVYPNGDSFEIFVLDHNKNTYKLKEKFGPYKSK
ncbi:MBL fold metallo-hydrolase [Polaribacter batillariae]|uniref:MBL fold metallo-hydrolase n=1 Tax=Polaribacter batillariae TaxID=2808900 RepID=A0ABX7SXZ8_9FLAO|nr:MBL fold metallo-hydrolase [Polaribacter batillariae]QTD38584.1 MBL fold metallo-hydrolase [Polaribacter batillariae]